MVFLDKKNKKYDQDNDDLGDVVDLTEDNPNVRNDLPAELPRIDLK